MLRAGFQFLLLIGSFYEKHCLLLSRNIMFWPESSWCDGQLCSRPFDMCVATATWFCYRSAYQADIDTGAKQERIEITHLQGTGLEKHDKKTMSNQLSKLCCLHINVRGSIGVSRTSKLHISQRKSDGTRRRSAKPARTKRGTKISEENKAPMRKVASKRYRSPLHGCLR